MRESDLVRIVIYAILTIIIGVIVIDVILLGAFGAF
jgi:hypothetical protein